MATGVLNALPRGFEFDGYRVERVLGTGGFGITYRANEVSIERRVAIKEYLPRTLAVREGTSPSVRPISSEDTGDFEYGLERFRDEAQTLVRLRHPNIVQVLKFFEANGTAYLVMDFVEGESLGNILKRDGTLTEPELHEVLHPLLDGIEYIHKAGFLHRDIKPDNIFIRHDGVPIMLDFGSARQALGEKSKTLTAIVTGGYAPFEQYTTGRGQGPWSDIYAMGATLYRAATGWNPPEATNRIIKDTYQPAAEAAVSGFSKTFLITVDAALAVRPDDRPQSVADWRAMFKHEGGRPLPERKNPSKAVPDDGFDATTRLGGSSGESAATDEAEVVGAGATIGVTPSGTAPAAALPVDSNQGRKTAANSLAFWVSGGGAAKRGAWSMIGSVFLVIVSLAMLTDQSNVEGSVALQFFASLALAYGFWETRVYFNELGFSGANVAIIVMVVAIPLSSFLAVPASSSVRAESNAILVVATLVLAVAFTYFGIRTIPFGRANGLLWQFVAWLYISAAGLGVFMIVAYLVEVAEAAVNQTSTDLLAGLTVLGLIAIGTIICHAMGLLRGARSLDATDATD